jgi:predicted acetyltransferase
MDFAPDKRPNDEQRTSADAPAAAAAGGGERLVLEEAAEKHREAAMALKQEFLDAGEPVMNGSALLDQMEFDEWLANCARNSNPDTVSSDWAVATTYFAVRASDGAVVGMIDVRHSLATDYLKEYAGHIGYSVRPSLRRRGYATQMLALALEKCRAFGVPVVRLGCYASNEASIRTIEANGGTLVEEKPYLDGIPMHIYEIAL